MPDQPHAQERGDLAVAAGRRLFVAIVVGVLSGIRTTILLRGKDYPGDFAQVWYAARSILSGQDPYKLIGPGRPFAFDFEFHYPLPAAVLGIPLSPLSADVAQGVFVGFGLGCLAWALMEYGHAPLIGLLSAAVGSAIDSVQWSPLLAAATVLTPVGIAYAAKPTIGLAMFAARPSRWALLGGLAVTVIAFIAIPGWVAEWRNALANRTGMTTLVLHPGGAFALLSLLRWRRPEARMLAVLACVPVTPALYETVPLLLIPRRWWEAALLVLASYFVLGLAMRAPLPDVSYYAAHMENSANVIALILYPLATLMVLRRRNEGTLPQWLEQRTTRWPGWLRGVPGPRR
jgi:hypothetical protein